MVSIRRRRLLGLCSGRNSFVAPLPKPEHENTPESHMRNTNMFSSISLTPLSAVCLPKELESISLVHCLSLPTCHLENEPDLPNVSASSPAKEHTIQHFPEVKCRKRHRRKHVDNQEPCIMRGVYLKNMKWQAAIKVDKKQIHLGTVGSQEEAARLYDRAAFLCGREPNFELSEEEKQELRKFKWEEFLAMTRSAITNKKIHRKPGNGLRRKPTQYGWASELGCNNGLPTSEDDTLGA